MDNRMKVVKYILILTAICALTLIAFITYPYIRWHIQLQNEEKNAAQSLHAVMNEIEGEHYDWNEVLEKDKTILIVDIKNCRNFQKSQSLINKTKFSAERLTLTIHDNFFEEVKYRFWDRNSKLDSLVFDYEKDLFQTQ